MTSKELLCFLTVAETRSYVKSADTLFYSQPTISYQIKALENELGFQLFKQNDRAQLTPAGEILYKHLKEWDDSWRRSLSAAKSAAADEREVLHIGIRRLINENFFSKGLNSFYHAQTDYTFCLHPFHIGGLVSDLIQGVRDVVVADSMEVMGIDSFDYQPLCRSCWGFAMSADDDLAVKKTINFEDLNGRCVILPHVPSGKDETAFDRACRRWMTPARVQYSNSHENAVITAAAGIAIASVNYSIPSQIEGSVFVPVKGFENYTHGLAWRKSDTRESIKQFVQAMVKAFNVSNDGVPDFIDSK